MKKKFTFLMAALMLLTMVLPWTVVGQEKTATTVLTLNCTTPAPTGSTSTALSSTSDVATFLNAAAGLSSASAEEKITCSAKTGDVYKGKGSGGDGIPQRCLKVGKASGSGGFTFTIPDSYDNVDVVEITCYGWKTTSSISINSGTAQTFTTAATQTTKTFELASSTKTIAVSVTTSAVCITEIVLKTNSGSTIATTTTIDASGITNNNVYAGTAAGSLSATVTYDDGGTPTAVPGATIAWNGNNDAVATINASTGVVTLEGAGTVTFTASYAGDATYSSSSKTYELTVINEDPTLATIWSENFSTYSANDVPNGGTYGYVCTNGGGTTKIYTENNAGGTSPELLVGKTNGTFEATVPLLTSTYGYSGDLTLTFKSNANSINVKSGTSDITVDGEASSGAGVTFNTKDTHTVTFKGTTVDNENIKIVFTATSSNVRIDDIVLKGAQTALTKVATPVISPAGGAVVSGTEVTMTCLTDGATIYYTTDGSTPSSSSTVYNSASKPTITSACTIKAIGIKSEWEDSDVASATYTIAEPCATPTFSPAAGEVAKGTTVEISTTTPEATIYYTTDGTDPTTSSTVYSSAITINTAVTLKAIAAKDGYANSAVASAAYTVIDYATLPFIWAGGTSSALSAETGVTLSGLGSDYAAQNAPYYLKMDGVGDYIQIKTDCQPGCVSIGVKMIGGGSTSKIKIQESNDGSSFTDVKELTISGSQNDILNFTTDVLFNESTRYVKILKSVHGSNIGVGPISIYKYKPAPSVNGNNEIESDVTIGNGESLIISSVIRIPSGRIIIVSNTGILVNDDAANLIIEDGGQLIVSNDDVAATFKKSIDAPSSKTDVYGWYTISSPVHDDGEETTIDVENVTNLVLNTDPSFKYDMFAYDEVNQKWLNRKKSTVSGHESDGFDIMNKGQGYIYRNSGEDIEFVGIVNYGDYTINDLTYTGAGDLAGFHLIGNPYSHNITLANTTLLDNDDEALETQLSGCYILRDDSWGTELTTEEIAPNQGFLVKISSSAKKIKFSETKRGVNYHSDNIKFMVANNQHEDVAYALFKDAIGLNKINHRNPEVPMLYINQNGEDFAIASMSDDTKAFNLNFKAGTMGKYTLSYKADGVFKYLHIYDRLTNTDVDMLLEGEYSFIATPNDNENRFIVMLGYMPDYSEGNDDVFAYQSGNEVLVSGTGELQIFDVTGRKVMTTTINGAESISVTAPGIYIFRLVGTDVKTQKIVVR